VIATLSTGASRARFVVGADGARSTVRELAGIAFPGFGAEQRFIMADVVGRLGNLEPDVRATFLGGGRFLIALPVGDGTLRLVTALSAAREPELADFEDARRATSAPPLVVESVRWLTRFHPRFHLAETFRKGRVLLAGDAAHVQSPMGAQGMNTGLQDAFNLAWKIAWCLHDASDRLLDSYDLERRHVAARVLAEAHRRTRAVISSPQRAEWRLRGLHWFGRAWLETGAQLRLGYRAVAAESAALLPGDASANWVVGERPPVPVAVSGFSLVPTSGGTVAVVRPDGVVGALVSSHSDLGKYWGRLIRFGVPT
jgi:2-polyprenyl-6-methoxyphenol hydroxylase-like FAD-dependent oxidoreductase